MKILIVDDNKSIRELIVENIKQSNDIIYECEDGDEAIEIFHKYKPDLVFMDIKMKRISGLTATQEIIKHYPKAKIIIVTNHNSAVFKKASFDAGAMDFIEKSNLLGLKKHLKFEVKEL